MRAPNRGIHALRAGSGSEVICVTVWPWAVQSVAMYFIVAAKMTGEVLSAIGITAIVSEAGRQASYWKLFQVDGENVADGFSRLVC